MRRRNVKHYVVVERTDKHGSRDGSPYVQAVTGKGDGLDLAWFAADSPGGVHIWRFTDEEKANEFARSRRAANAVARAETGRRR
jgi:hypothetical protein